MAIVNKGFPGTVNATEYAKSWHLGGSDACDGTGWLTTQGTGRQASTAAGDAFASGVLSTNSAPILTSIPTPVAGQWFLIVRRIDWAGSGTVTVVAVAHTTTSTTVPTSAPGTFPTINNAPGSLYDHKLGWAWARNTDTTMAFFDLREKPLESRLADVNTLLFQAYSNVLFIQNSGAGRSTGAVFPFANPAALDAASTAIIGDMAQVTTPGTGVDPIYFRAVAGTGANIAWRISSTIYANTKANLDTATTTLTGIADVIFRSGDQAYAADTAITYRWNGTTWDPWASGWITWTTAPSNLTVGTGGSAGTVQRYKYINGRIWFECAYTLGTSGQSVGTNPQINLPFSIAMLGGVNGGMLLGDGIVYDAAPGAAVSNFVKAIQITASTVFPRTYNGTVTAISATAPITFAAGDKIAVGFWGDPA